MQSAGMVSAVPQALTLASKLPPMPESDPTKPRVLIPSALSKSMTREQEDAMINHAKRRQDELGNELGLRQFDSPNWFSTAYDESGVFRRRHLDTRHMAIMGYEMRFEWRPSVLGGIFTDSNLHIPMTRRILQQVIARMINYYLGTDPYFAAYDVGIEDKDFADRLERWLRHELDAENDTKSTLASIIERVLICGDCPVALSYNERVSYYQSEKPILIGPDGEPVLAMDGDYIIQGQDQFIEQQMPVMDPATGQPAIDPVTGAPVMQPTGIMVLKRDGQTRMPDAEKYETRIIWRRTIVESGAQAEVLMPHDFLYPLNCKNLDAADCLVHFYDEPLINLIHRILTVGNLPPDQVMEYVGKLAQQLIAYSGTTPEAAVNKSRADLNEPLDSNGADRQEPQINWSRFCLWYDALNTGNQGNILLIMTRNGEIPLFYDYVENITPDKRRPYRLPTINKIPGRAHGMGLVEIFEPIQTEVDLLFNRWQFSLSRSGKVIAWQPENTTEGEDNPNLDINGGECLHLKPGKTLAETVQTVDIYDTKGQPLREMIEFLMQIAMNMSGIANVNDGQALGLDTTKLATGVRNLEKSGQEITDKLVADLRGGMKDILRSLMLLCAANLQSPKTFRFFNGDVGQLATISPDEVKNITLDVDLELTKYRGEQQLQQNSQAANAAQMYYQQQNPEVQNRLAPLFRDILKANGVKNPNDVIAPLTMAFPPVGPDGQPAAASTPPPV
jgi:hypothetical protein